MLIELMGQNGPMTSISQQHPGEICLLRMQKPPHLKGTHIVDIETTAENVCVTKGIVGVILLLAANSVLRNSPLFSESWVG
jgi:hypothetical protein